ncbi:MAG: hypothetical protein PHV34_18205 [Verrucomicrobiae bacterium]|nr:hypothetical protein [Verrucomicrobiae bacterium]
MTLIAEYHGLMERRREQRLLGAAGHCEACQAPAQLRVEISPTGWGMTLLRGGTSDEIRFGTAAGYEQAMEEAARRMQKDSLLKAGMALVTLVWPPSFDVRQRKLNTPESPVSLEALDLQMRLQPDDPAFLYRAIPGKSEKDGQQTADVIGISTSGLEHLEKRAPSGVRIGRHWGALAAIDAAYSRFREHLAERVLIGLCDARHVYYLCLQQNRASGMRVNKRGSLRDAADARQCAYLHEVKQVCFICLTAECQDVERVGEELAGSQIDASMMGRDEMLKCFPELAPCRDMDQLPLALFSGGNHGRL